MIIIDGLGFCGDDKYWSQIKAARDAGIFEREFRCLWIDKMWKEEILQIWLDKETPFMKLMKGASSISPKDPGFKMFKPPSHKETLLAINYAVGPPKDDMVDATYFGIDLATKQPKRRKKVSKKKRINELERQVFELRRALNRRITGNQERLNKVERNDLVKLRERVGYLESRFVGRYMDRDLQEVIARLPQISRRVECIEKREQALDDFLDITFETQPAQSSKLVAVKKKKS